MIKTDRSVRLKRSLFVNKRYSLFTKALMLY
jgi:hypothetical protein